MPGQSASQVVLVGGGDPTLAGAAADPAGTYPAAASLAGLAKATAKALIAAGTKSITLTYDATLYAGPTSAEGWKPTYITAGNVAPVSSLEVDEGRRTDKTLLSRIADPAQSAADEFAGLLRHDGLTVAAGVAPGVAATGAKALAKVTSAPIAALVERMLRISDNDLAESLARQVALRSTSRRRSSVPRRLSPRRSGRWASTPRACTWSTGPGSRPPTSCRRRL